jgi:hypothetical protein
MITSLRALVQLNYVRGIYKTVLVDICPITYYVHIFPTNDIYKNKNNKLVSLQGISILLTPRTYNVINNTHAESLLDYKNNQFFYKQVDKTSLQIYRSLFVN